MINGLPCPFHLISPAQHHVKGLGSGSLSILFSLAWSLQSSCRSLLSAGITACAQAEHTFEKGTPGCRVAPWDSGQSQPGSSGPESKEPCVHHSHHTIMAGVRTQFRLRLWQTLALLLSSSRTHAKI